MQCLNLKNKEVKAAFDEVAKVLNSEDAAYYVISENNGYAIDQDPDGSQSQLFQDLLQKYNGDRDKAIIERAKSFDYLSADIQTRNLSFEEQFLSSTDENARFIEDIKVIMDFTDELKDDIRTVAREVIDAYNNRTNALSDERLVSLNKNYFGFYCKYANEVYNSLVDLSSYSDIIGTKEYDKLMSDLSICKSILDACSDHVKRMQVQNAREIMLNNGIQVGSPTIYNYLAENTKETNNDISSLTRWFGAGDKINDEAIKTLFNILQNTENTINNLSS